MFSNVFIQTTTENRTNKFIYGLNHNKRMLLNIYFHVQFGICFAFITQSFRVYWLDQNNISLTTHSIPTPHHPYLERDG